MSGYKGKEEETRKWQIEQLRRDQPTARDIATRNLEVTPPSSKPRQKGPAFTR